MTPIRTSTPPPDPTIDSGMMPIDPWQFHGRGPSSGTPYQPVTQPAIPPRFIGGGQPTFSPALLQRLLQYQLLGSMIPSNFSNPPAFAKWNNQFSSQKPPPRFIGPPIRVPPGGDTGVQGDQQQGNQQWGWEGGPGGDTVMTDTLQIPQVRLPSNWWDSGVISGGPGFLPGSGTLLPSPWTGGRPYTGPPRPRPNTIFAQEGGFGKFPIGPQIGPLGG